MIRSAAVACVTALVVAGAVPAFAATVLVKDPENRPEGVGPEVSLTVGNPHMVGNPDIRPAHVITDGAGLRLEVVVPLPGEEWKDKTCLPNWRWCEVLPPP
jgi:hypothetical protein